MSARAGVTACRRYRYSILSAAVGTMTVLALARANYLVRETVDKACGGIRDTIRWSLNVQACRLADVGQFDLVNGGFVVLAVLAALNPTLIVMRIVLLVLVLMYLNDAGEMYATRIATGRIYPGIELWWLPIFWLSTLILLVAVVFAAFGWAKRWRDSRRCGSAAGA